MRCVWYNSFFPLTARPLYFLFQFSIVYQFGLDLIADFHLDLAGCHLLSSHNYDSVWFCYFTNALHHIQYLLSEGCRKRKPATWAVCFGLDKCQAPTKTALSLSLLSWTGERKYDERVQGRDKDRERSLTSYCHGQNRLNLGRKGSLIYHQSNQSRIMRNKTKP